VANLKLYLAEGFRGDHVVVKVDGRTVFDSDSVTTKDLYGLAEELKPVQVKGDKAKIEIELPDKGVNAAFSADLKRGDQVPISLEDGQITHFVGSNIGFA
jgi:hypothetical protein